MRCFRCDRNLKNKSDDKCMSQLLYKKLYIEDHVIFKSFRLLIMIIIRYICIGTRILVRVQTLFGINVLFLR